MEQIKQLMFRITKKEREAIREKYKGKIPEPLTNQVPDRVSKETAIGRHDARKWLRTELFPSGNMSLIHKNRELYYLDSLRLV